MVTVNGDDTTVKVNYPYHNFKYAARDSQRMMTWVEVALSQWGNGVCRITNSDIADIAVKWSQKGNFPPDNNPYQHHRYHEHYHNACNHRENIKVTESIKATKTGQRPKRHKTIMKLVERDTRNASTETEWNGVLKHNSIWRGHVEKETHWNTQNSHHETSMMKASQTETHQPVKTGQETSLQETGRKRKTRRQNFLVKCPHVSFTQLPT